MNKEFRYRNIAASKSRPMKTNVLSSPLPRFSRSHVLISEQITFEFDRAQHSRIFLPAQSSVVFVIVARDYFSESDDFDLSNK